MNTPATTTGDALPAKTFKDLLLSDSYRNSIAAALPKHITADRMVRVVLTAMNRQPKLLQCTKESLWQSVMDCASLGLEPDALGRAYLVPYEDRKNNRLLCQLQIGYKGLADLAYRSGLVESLQAQVVYDKDVFEFQFGITEKLHHIPASGEKRGIQTHAYAYCRLKGGAFKFDVMTAHDVERIRQKSKATSGPWMSDWDEMAKKTVFKRLAKMLPLSSEVRQAIERDNETEALDLSRATGPDMADRLAPDTTPTVDTTAETVDKP
jgi:recombination protein RecT